MGPSFQKKRFEQKKWLGQHFLNERLILQMEAKALACCGKSALEIGAGDGRLSECVLAEKPSSLTLVEIDFQLAQLLAKKFKGEKRVRIYEGDALDFIASFPRPSRFFDCVIGNIPYQISGPFFAALCSLDFSRGIFCVQKEVAQRLAATPGTGDWGRLSIAVQLRYDVKILASIPPESFDPPPKVDSAIIEIFPKEKNSVIRPPPNFNSVVAALFAHRLQSVPNSLYNSRTMLSLQKNRAKGISRKIIYSSRKVFTLSVEELAEIARILWNEGD